MAVRLSLLIATYLVLSGCASIDSVEPEIPALPDHFIEPVQTSEKAPLGPDAWWMSFADEKLNNLISLALANNYSLKASYARLKQSEAQWGKAGSGQLPSLDFTLQRSQVWQSSNSNSREFEVGVDASYELDFWGRVSALDEQALQQYYAMDAAVNIQTNTVVSQVALSWYGWVKETQQLQLLHNQQDRIKNALTVVRGRYLRGKVVASDIWQQEQLLESINAEIINSETLQDIYRQQLALWLGKNYLAEEVFVLPSENYQIPEILQATEKVSSVALQERPDVLQAYAQLQAASAGLKVSETNRYPRFTLSASYNRFDDTPEKILTNWIGTFIAGLTVPLFDGGNLAADVRLNEALVEEQLANYQQVLLVAMQEIEEALLNEKQQISLQASVNNQLKLANQTQDFNHQRYLQGIGDFLALLTSQQDVLALERQALGAEFLQLQYRIQLLTTLSHGRFSNVDEEEVEDE
ncbi:MAG TPA: hypothetical protein DIC30_06885 [Oceanospirillales bacterium]|nr:hypothetical protein [Oleispira sp.]HCM05720.1 hypothetical protein [Oceanospirillales bacterium]|tara:strand:+ start:10799 stop:12202 length:1404 start_codon:yes stop_codon:yes gene_type:complete